MSDVQAHMNSHYEVVFIDYSINHEDPFEIAYQFKQANPMIVPVFLTRFQNNEAEVFENYDIEYILKPINPYRLKTVIQKIKRMKFKPIEKFVGEVSVKLFGNMEVKIFSRNVRFNRRIHKEIIAYLILNGYKASAVKMAQAIMSNDDFAYSLHDLKALIYQTREEIDHLKNYMDIQYIDHEYHLILNKVKIDYLQFMNVDIHHTNMHKVECSLLSYGKGLLYNFSSDWAKNYALDTKKHFFELQHKLIHKLELTNDKEKLRSILFNLKQYCETDEDWEFFNHVVQHNFPLGKQEHLLFLE